MLGIKSRQRRDAGRGGEEALRGAREQIATVVEAGERAGDGS
jgi:hypothetical protein